MRIRLELRDQRSILSCHRSDGSVTWSTSRHGAFFARHDLMHYAVESTLGLRDSFFGLIARGWHVPDFEQSGIAARLPAEAIHTECMVNQLLIDIADGLTPNTEDFNRLIQAAAAQSPRHANVSPRSLSDDELHNIRRRYAELSAALITTDAGTMIELEFEDHA